MAVSNFAFLDPFAPPLAKLGAQAETYLRQDPQTSLLKLRIFGEELTKLVVERRKFVRDDIDGQHDLVNALRGDGLISKHEAALFHALRRNGNRAAHDSLDDARLAEEGLKDAHTLSVLIAEQLFPGARSGAFRSPLSFSPAEHSDNASQALTGQLASLKSALEESTRQNRLDAVARQELADEMAAMKRALQSQESVVLDAKGKVAANADKSRLVELEARFAALEADFVRALGTSKPLVRKESTTTARSSQPSVPSSQSTPPLCPECAAPTTRRTARKGPRAGKEFWGCSRYPNCKGIVNIDDAAEEDEVGAENGLPRFRLRSAEWRDAGERPGWRTEYLQVGGRLRAVDPLQRSSEFVRAAASHIGLFVYSGKSGAREASREAAEVAAIGRRLATRGSRPPIDPQIEQIVLEKANLTNGLQKAMHPGDLAATLEPVAEVPDLDDIEAALLHRSKFVRDTNIKLHDGKPLLDPKYEVAFIDGLEKGGCDPAAGNWIIPQAGLDALVSSNIEWGARRVDFLIFHPLMGAPQVLELDGQQHADAQAADEGRDEELEAAGVGVLRFPGQRLRDAFAEVTEIFFDIDLGRGAFTLSRSPAALLAWAPALANRTLLCVSEALGGGLMEGKSPTIVIRESSGLGLEFVKSALETLDAIAGVRGADVVPTAATVVFDGLSTELRRTARGKYDVVRKSRIAGPPAATFGISLATDVGPFHRLAAEDPNVPEFVVRPTMLPVSPRSSALTTAQIQRVSSPDTPDAVSLHRLLIALFAKAEFQPDGPHPRAQEVAIRRLLAGRDTVVLLPTGAGKSLIYQLAGLLQPGMTLIIDPLVSLIDDQLDGLRNQGIDRALGITSADTRGGVVEEKLGQLRSGETYFAFVAPERLQNSSFREAMRELSTGVPINCAVVDESHCVSEWGHDFRTAYLDLGKVLRDVCQDAFGGAPPLLALTGTASRSVLKDMLIELSIDRSDPAMLITPSSFDRPELRFQVVRADSDELEPRFLGVMASLPRLFRGPGIPTTTAGLIEPRGARSICGIVFCRTVRSARTGPPGVFAVAKMLRERLGVPVPIYTGQTDDHEKRRNARQFKSNEATILVATKAYGMGIDKPNIRYVVHMGIPGSIEGYYQEAGRAGRSRQESHCVILSSPEDLELIDYFFGKSYQGVEADLEQIKKVLNELGDVDARSRRDIPMGLDSERIDRERAVHRLKLLGLIKDYTVDWGGRRFSCKVQPVTAASLDAALLAFVRRSQPARAVAFQRQIVADRTLAWKERLVKHAARMLEFIYETIAASRQRAAREMFLLAEQAKSDADIRDRILRYLTLSEVADTLEELSDRTRFSFDDWIPHYDAIEAGDDARDWRGATGRLLGASPDHPGLLVGRGLVEAVVPKGDPSVFATSLSDGLRSARERYAVSADDVAHTLAHLLAWTRMRVPAWVSRIYLVCDAVFGENTPPAILEQETFALQPGSNADLGELTVVHARRVRRVRQELVGAATKFTTE